MTYTLYGDRRSGSAAVELVLAELGATYETHAVPLEGDHQLSACHCQLNPMGRIPVLVLPDGTVVTESLAILLTLALRHPGAGLLPDADPDRARVLRWMALLAGEFYPQVTRYDYPARFLDDASQHAALRDRAQAMGRAIWPLLEAELGQGPYLLGPRFSLADPYIAVLSRWMQGEGWTPLHAPRVQALARAVAGRPACAAAWQRHFDMPA